MLLNIAGLWLHFKGSNEYFEERSMLFKREDAERVPEQCDIRISLELFDDLKKPEGSIIYSGPESTMLRKNPPEDGYYIYTNDFIMNNGKRKPPEILDADSSWTDIHLKYVHNDEMFALRPGFSLIQWNQYSSFLSAGIGFRYMLLRREGVQIHCSSIDYKGKGLIFSAPSGTGKSTHVGLWCELFGDDVTIINEDRPAIRYIDNAPMICGTPWSGTSDNFVNKIVPLSGIVMLEQAPENTIERLSGPIVLQLLMPRCFLPYFDAELMVEAMNILERLVKDVPVYLLKCRPDYEAVELVRKCLI